MAKKRKRKKQPVSKKRFTCLLPAEVLDHLRAVSRERSKALGRRVSMTELVVKAARRMKRGA